MTTIHIIVATLIALAFWWLLKDYPTWRQNQLQLAKQYNDTTIDPTHQKSLYSSTQQRQQQQDPSHVENDTGKNILDHGTEKITPSQQNQTTTCHLSNDNDASTTQDQPTKALALNLTQYTLMIPMAVVYLVGRTMIDIARGCLFHLLYKIEQAAPAIDAWLFDKVTVWLPKKYDQADTWWTTRGRHIFNQWQHDLIHHTIPTTIDYIDAFFLWVYNGGQLLMDTLHKIGNSLRLFQEKHDWRQLAIDMGNIGYTLFWQPFAWVVTHVYRLGRLFCLGCWYGLKATWDDLRWIATVMIPLTMDWVKTTRGWVWIKHAWHWCQSLAINVAFKVVMVFSPVLRFFGRWMVRIGDVLGTWIRSEWVKSIWVHIRHVFINNGLWLGGELVILVHSVKTMATMMVDNGLVPLIQLFMIHVVPRLSDSYQRFLNKSHIIYQHYVQPIGEQCMAWCGKAFRPLIHLLGQHYQAFLSFLSRWHWDGILQVSAVITQSLQWMMGSLLGSLGPSISYMVSTVVYHHLPRAVEYVQYGLKKMIDTMDTSAMMSAMEQLYQMIQEQGLLLFASLERTMNEWKEAQQDADGRADKGKGAKIS